MTQVFGGLHSCGRSRRNFWLLGYRPAPITVAIWGVDQQLEKSLSFLLCVTPPFKVIIINLFKRSVFIRHEIWQRQLNVEVFKVWASKMPTTWQHTTSPCGSLLPVLKKRLLAKSLPYYMDTAPDPASANCRAQQPSKGPLQTGCLLHSANKRAT